MAEFDALLHKDSDDKRTSSEWDEATSSWIQKVQVVETSAGSDPAIGSISDPAEEDPTVPATALARLASIAGALRVANESLFKGQSTGAFVGDVGVGVFGLRKDTPTSEASDGEYTFFHTDSLGRLRVRVGGGGVPEGVTPAAHSSGNVANASAVATIPAVASKTTYISGFTVTGLGATAAGVVLVAITGLAAGTLTYVLAIPAGVTEGVVPLNVTFPTPLPGSAVNTAVVVTAPAFGVGNTNAAVTAHGFNV